jgi:hypothetical protein
LSKEFQTSKLKVLFLGTHSNETLFEKVHLLCLRDHFEVIRINLEDFLPNRVNRIEVSISSDDAIFEINDHKHYLSQFSVLWKRRISNNFMFGERVFHYLLESIPESQSRKLIKELYELRDLILIMAKKNNIRIINDYNPDCLSKPFQNLIAKNFGLLYPNMLVSNSKKNIKGFIQANNDKCITKPLGGIGYLFDEDYIMSLNTTRLTVENVDDIKPNIIFPSLVQTYIKSKYELKCILVGEELFCVKQFIEVGNIPTVDIKEAYKKKLIQNVEYELNSLTKERIIKLCKFFKLDLCTIDIIKSTEDKYYFIEINPDGIIEYYSQFLNISIYKEIFNLIKVDSNSRKNS